MPKAPERTKDLGYSLVQIVTAERVAFVTGQIQHSLLQRRITPELDKQKDQNSISGGAYAIHMICNISHWCPGGFKNIGFSHISCSLGSTSAPRAYHVLGTILHDT